MKSFLILVILLMTFPVNVLVSQEYKYKDMASFNEGYTKTRSLQENKNNDEAFNAYLDLISSFHLAYNSAPDKKSRDDLEKKLGDIWYQVAVIGGQSGNTQAAITGYYYACGYGYKDACSSIKIFMQTKIHNDNNLRTLPGFGKCTEGDCIDGWGVYKWDNGPEYEGEWLNGVFSGAGSYLVEGELASWKSCWRNGDYSFECDKNPCPYTEGYPKWGSVKFGKMGVMGLKHYSSGDPVLKVSGDSLIFDYTNGYYDLPVYSAGNPIFQDFVLEATVIAQGGPATQGNGLVFRAWDNDYYVFNVTNDGRTAFYTVQNDTMQWHEFSEGQTSSKLAFPCIKPGAPNTIKVVAIGTSVELFINGTSVGKFTEEMQTRGKIGVFLSAGNKIAFKNFKVYAP